MLSNELKVEECDATMLNSSIGAGIIKIIDTLLYQQFR